MGAVVLAINPTELEELASQGLSLAMIGLKLGIHRTTLSRRLKDNKTLATAYKRGQQRDIQDVVNALKYNAIEKNNVIAQIFFLKNKDSENWKDTHDVKHSGNLTINTGFRGKTIEHE